MLTDADGGCWEGTVSVDLEGQGEHGTHNEAHSRRVQSRQHPAVPEWTSASSLARSTSPYEALDPRAAQILTLHSHRCLHHPFAALPTYHRVVHHRLCLLFSLLVQLTSLQREAGDPNGFLSHTLSTVQTLRSAFYKSTHERVNNRWDVVLLGSVALCVYTHTLLTMYRWPHGLVILVRCAARSSATRTEFTTQALCNSSYPRESAASLTNTVERKFYS